MRVKSMDTNYKSFDTDTLAKNLIKARESSGKTVKVASNLLGIPTSRLKNYEKGKYIPSLPEFESLSYIYRIPLFALMSDILIDNYIHSPDQDQMRKLIEIRQRIIATHLQLAREKKSISYKTLSIETGISTARIKRYEEGSVSTPLNDLAKICDALGLELFELIDSESPVGRWQTRQSAVAAINSMPDEIVDFVTKTENEKYLWAAKKIADIGFDNLRDLSSSLSEISNIFPVDENASKE